MGLLLCSRPVFCGHSDTLQEMCRLPVEFALYNIFIQAVVIKRCNWYGASDLTVRYIVLNLFPLTSNFFLADGFDQR